MQAKQYRKRPVTIEAVCFDEPNDPHEIAAWCGGTICGDPKIAPIWIEIPTLEGVMRGDVGDFIIRGVKGEFYPCKPDIFAQTNEECGPLYAAKIQRHYAKDFGLTAPSDIGVLVYFDEHKAAMSEAWSLVNAMAGQEPRDRAERWLEENKQYAPDGARRL